MPRAIATLNVSTIVRVKAASLLQQKCSKINALTDFSQSATVRVSLVPDAPVLFETAQHIESSLFQQYGGLLDSATAAKVLGYPSAEALIKARSRGALALPMMRIPHRRGWWTTPHDVACYLDSLRSPSAASEPKALGRRPKRIEGARPIALRKRSTAMT